MWFRPTLGGSMQGLEGVKEGVETGEDLGGVWGGAGPDKGYVGLVWRVQVVGECRHTMHVTLKCE